VINKVTDAPAADVQVVFDNAKQVNPNAQIVMAASELVIANGDAIKEKRVLLVDDGRRSPTAACPSAPPRSRPSVTAPR